MCYWRDCLELLMREVSAERVVVAKKCGYTGDVGILNGARLSRQSPLKLKSKTLENLPIAFTRGSTISKQ